VITPHHVEPGCITDRRASDVGDHDDAIAFIRVLPHGSLRFDEAEWTKTPGLLRQISAQKKQLPLWKA